MQLPEELSQGSIGWIISSLIAVIVSLIIVIKILYKQTLKQQNQVEELLSETKELMGGVAELIRNSNTLMVEVKDTMLLCKKRE